MSDLASLTCYLLPAKIQYCDPRYHAIHENAYRFWHSIIQSALREEGNTEVAAQLGSDMFYENDEMVLLCEKENPVGLFMFRWINRRFQSERELSAFTKRFPEDLFQMLAEKNYDHVMLMAHLAVHPEWRKSKRGAGIADILVDFSLRQFLNSNADVFITTTRNNRGTNTLGFRHGAVRYEYTGKVFNVDSDIIIFYRDRVIPIELQELREIADNLWQHKLSGWSTLEGA